MTPIKILVTGADGFLGQSVVRKIRSSGLPVRAVSQRTKNALDVVHCDLASSDQSIAMLLAEKPNVIINLAAQVDLTRNPTSDLWPINTHFPIRASEYARQYGAYLVQASSIAIHGGSSTMLGANSEVRPDSLYGRSKAVADYAIQASGCDHAIVRFGGIFGLQGPRHLQLNVQLDNACAGKVPTVAGEGRARRNYLYVEDAATVIEACVLERLGGIFYAGGECLTFMDMLTAIGNEWFPGAPLKRVAASDGPDQLVEASTGLPASTPFAHALRDIRARHASTNLPSC